MVFAWLRRRRRARILAAPFPQAWLEILERQIVDYPLLSEKQQVKLRDDLRIFVAEKNWEGCNGLVLTDETKVVIAALACLLTLEIVYEGDPYGRVPSILVYPTAFKTPKVRRLGGSEFTLVGEQALEGEAVYRGAVLLNWSDIAESLAEPGSGHNLVWHEFAHQLDMLDGSIDGTPPLPTAELRLRWHDVMTAEYEQLVNDVRHRQPTLVDRGARENAAEFFAYSTECFFDCPLEMRELHPRLYAMLDEYYRQDPAQRAPRAWRGWHPGT
jgi:Mlc titration factor MtfA (ptsG expression regulator)